MKVKAVFLAISFLITGCGSSEHWPVYLPDPTWKTAVSQVRAAYIAKGYSYDVNLQNYSPTGDFLGWSLTDHWHNEPGLVQLDENGVPMIFYNGQFYYNPVTVAQFSLAEHGKFLRGIEPDPSKFMAGANKLLELQSSDGSFPYTFDFVYYRNPKYFHAPWTSAMAQGQALSVFARAWAMTGNPRFIMAGNSAFEFLCREDTVDLRYLDPSLSMRVFADEYPAKPSAYTLNGFMFTMLGVYDWSRMNTAGVDHAATKSYFDHCLGTLNHILPYYDAGGWSTYDLGHIVYKQAPDLTPSYHVVHIYLLHALFSVTADPVLKKYEMLWRSDVSISQ